MGKGFNKQAGFGVLGVVLVVVVLALLSTAAYFVYRAQSNPAENSTAVHQTNTQKQENSSTSTTYFTISEWGVRAAYADTDLSYSASASDSKLMLLTSQKLTTAGPGSSNCTTGNAGSIGKYLPNDVVPGPAQKTAQQYLVQDFSGSTAPHYSKVGDYYYIWWNTQSDCVTDTSLLNQVRGAATDIVDHLQATPN